MRLSKSFLTKWPWLVTVICFALYGAWQLIAMFYGWLPFGLSKIILAVASVCAIPQFFIARTGFRLSLREIVALLLIVAIMVVVALQVLFFPNLTDLDGNTSHAYLPAVAASNIAWLMVGYAFQARGVAKHSNWFSIILLCSAAIPVIGALHGGLVIDYWTFRDNVEDANHLTISAAAYYLLIMSYAFATGWLRVGVFLMSLPVLFALGGRADLLIMIASVVMYEWLRGVRRSKFIHVLMILALGIGILASLPSSVFNQGGVSRMVFANGVSQDASYAERQEFMATDIRALPEQALVGDVSRLIVLHGGLGSYIHNLLSVWQFYGAFIFFLVLAILTSNFRRIRRLVRDGTDALGTFGALTFLSACIGVIIAKSLTYQGLWLTLGFFAGNAVFKARRHFQVDATGARKSVSSALGDNTHSAMLAIDTA